MGERDGREGGREEGGRKVERDGGRTGSTDTQVAVVTHLL